MLLSLEVFHFEISGIVINEILELRQYFPIENIKEKNKDKLEIAVVGFKDIFDISHMFDDCSLLETLNFTDLSNEIFIKNK